MGGVLPAQRSAVHWERHHHRPCQAVSGRELTNITAIHGHSWLVYPAGSVGGWVRFFHSNWLDIHFSRCTKQRSRSPMTQPHFGGNNPCDWFLGAMGAWERHGVPQFWEEAPVENSMTIPNYGLKKGRLSMAHLKTCRFCSQNRDWTVREREKERKREREWVSKWVSEWVGEET